MASVGLMTITGLVAAVISSVPRRMLAAVAVIGALAAPAAAQARQLPATAVDTAGGLDAVTCTGTDNCWAVGGTTSNTPLIEQWNGMAWQQVASPPPPKVIGSALSGVACATVTECWAVGGDSSHQGGFPFAEQWNGTAWSEVAMPSPPSTFKASGLSAVQCPAANFCIADGNYYRVSHGKAFSTALLEVWHGTSWQIVPAPALPHATTTTPQSLSCTGTSACWATGVWLRYEGGECNPGGGFGYYWNGTQWTAHQIGKATACGRDLYAVSCVTSQMCMGIGSNSRLQPWAERWTGSAWVTASSGLPSSVLAVSCPASQLCMGVGNGPAGTLAARWNGTSWATVPSPNRPRSQNQFRAVTCLQASYCWAVGGWFKGHIPHEVRGTLAEQWNGTNWTIVPS